MVVLIALLLATASAILEANHYVIKTTDSAVLAAVKNPAHFTIGLMYTTDMTLANVYEEVITAITSRYKDYIIVYGVDCTLDYETCPESRRRLLPTTSGWSLSHYDTEGNAVVHNTNYSGNVSITEMARWVEEHLPYLGMKLNTANYEAFLGQEQAKVLLFSNRMTSPNIFKGLSSYFRGKLAFGFVNREETDLVARFNVVSFPTLVVIDGSGNPIEYDGVLEYIPAKQFLAAYASRSPLGPPMMDKVVFHEPEIFDPKMFKVETLTPTNFTEIVGQKKQLSLIHFYKGEAHENWLASVERYEGLIFLATMDCSSAESQTFAKALGVKRYPSVRLFKTPTKSTEMTFDSVADLDELVISRLEASYTTVTDYTIENFITEATDSGRQGILLFTNEDIPVQYLALVSKFQNEFEFGYYRKNNRAIVKSLKARRYPTLLMITKGEGDKIQTVEYEAELSSYPLMHFFLDSIVRQRSKPTSSLGEQAIELEQVNEYYSKNFDDLCGRKSGVCVIGLFKGNAVRFTQFDPNNASQLSALKKIKVEARQNKAQIRVGWFDAHCEHELRDFLEFTDEQLPVVVLYLAIRRK